MPRALQQLVSVMWHCCACLCRMGRHFSNILPKSAAFYRQLWVTHRKSADLCWAVLAAAPAETGDEDEDDFNSEDGDAPPRAFTERSAYTGEPPGVEEHVCERKCELVWLRSELVCGLCGYAVGWLYAKGAANCACQLWQ